MVPDVASSDVIPAAVHCLVYDLNTDLSKLMALPGCRWHSDRHPDGTAV